MADILAGGVIVAAGYDSIDMKLHIQNQYIRKLAKRAGFLEIAVFNPG